MLEQCHCVGKGHWCLEWKWRVSLVSGSRQFMQSEGEKAECMAQTQVGWESVLELMDFSLEYLFFQ